MLCVLINITVCFVISGVMPEKCCVTGCRGNYEATAEYEEEKVSVFRFPKDPELRAKWIRLIPRENLTVHDKTVVCEKHFAQHFILRVDSATRPDGSILTVPRKNPKLTADAYPTIFPNTPSYLTSEPSRKRKAPEDRRLEMSARDEQQFLQWMTDDQISSFDVFCDKIDNFVSDVDNQWVIIRSCGCVNICMVDMSNVPQFLTVIKIHETMEVEVYGGNSRLSNSSLAWVLGAECKLVCWSQISSLMSHFASVSVGVDVSSVKSQADIVKQHLQELIELANNSDDYEPDVVSRLKFLSEQISLLFMSQLRYSSETFLISFRFFAISASVYNRLRSTVLTLPHVSYIKRLSSVFSLSGGLHESDHAVYLKHKAQLLEPHELHVMLLLDEIYVEPKTTYKGGSLTGMASNIPSEQASTVQTFMMCSLLSPNKDVAAMVPVKNLTAEYLKVCTLEVITMLENAGYYVFCLISDNNRVNRNMFTCLCGGDLTPFIQHPCAADRKLFFLFDSVHLLKCLRNNWLGQCDAENTFQFPDMNDGSICKASMSHLRQLYASEKDNYIKMAPCLTYKALHPSNLERQNVKLVLKIFDEKTIIALDTFGNNSNTDMSGTSKFMKIILRLWKILNVKSTGKGRRKRDTDMDPIRHADDSNVVFLREVYSWLVQWEALQQKVRQGRLSNETLFALKHTVATFVELIKYLFDELHVSYVLTGKFQTDCLEFRFSQYRQLSGANYHVSVQEIKESEKKLKVISMLHVMSASRGNISIQDFLIKTDETKVTDTCSVDAAVTEFLPVLELCDDAELSQSETQPLVFVAGYVGQKVSSKLTCDLCKQEVISDKGMQCELNDDYQYLRDISRGGLNWPTDFSVEVVTQVFIVFRIIVSKDYESKFLAASNQKTILMKLSVERLMACGAVVGECTCGRSMLSLAEMALSSTCNIFLNNYCKSAADKRSSGKQKGKRKLSTLTTGK